MKSMTGYGKAEYNENGLTIVVELKTVNNRFLDLNMKYPRGFLATEDAIRKAVQSKLVRGKVDLFVTYRDLRQNSNQLEVDLPLANSYVNCAKLLKEEFNDLTNDFTINSLIRLNDVVKPSQDGLNIEELTPILSQTVLDACDNLNKMREFEGEKLKVDLLSRVQTIEGVVLKICEYAPQVQENYRVKLKERIDEILSDSEIDETRLLQETAIFADKCNIDEELTRLKSHISQFRKICEETVDVGKKLDFLVQEFNREANTICSKSNDVSVTDNALKLKCEIEKVREQIQNIE